MLYRVSFETQKRLLFCNFMGRLPCMQEITNTSVEQFEQILGRAVTRLTDDLRNSDGYHTPEAFEKLVENVLRDESSGSEMTVERTFRPSAFPDIKVGSFGVEVKYTSKDRWHTVGNSIFEGMRDEDVKNIYLVFGKGGGTPEARWSRYEECITDVRLTHAPSFVIDMDEPSLLFNDLNMSYDEFSEISREDKIKTIKEYYTKQLKPEDRMWWMEETSTFPIQIRQYSKLSKTEKRMLRGEIAILFPQICGASYLKFVDVALYLLQNRGIFCPNVRDQFTSGFAAEEGDRISGIRPRKGEPQILRTLRGLERNMQNSVQTLDEELLIKYWGENYHIEDRLNEWLRKADGHASGWVPSESLFLDRSAGQLDTTGKLTLF